MIIRDGKTTEEDEETYVISCSPPKEEVKKTEYPIQDLPKFSTGGTGLDNYMVMMNQKLEPITIISKHKYDPMVINLRQEIKEIPIRFEECKPITLKIEQSFDPIIIELNHNFKEILQKKDNHYSIHNLLLDIQTVFLLLISIGIIYLIITYII